MADFLILEKGNMDNLEGKVISYGKLIKNDLEFGIDIVAVYSASNLLDFKEKFGEGELDEMNRIIAEVKSKLPREESVKAIPFYSILLPISVEDIKIVQEDVIYVGEFSDFEQCSAAASAAAVLYMANYDKQRKLKAGITRTEPTEELEKTYFDVEENKADYLQSNYISPLMHALENSNIENAKKIAQDFIRFSAKSPLVDDAYNAAAVLNSNKIEQKKNLLHAYFKKILAIASERFEDAAKIRDEIKAMKDKKE